MSYKSLETNRRMIPIDNLDPTLTVAIQAILAKRAHRKHLDTHTNPTTLQRVDEATSGLLTSHIFLYFLDGRQQLALVGAELEKIWAEIHTVVSERLGVNIDEVSAKEIDQAIKNLYPNDLNMGPLANSHTLLLDLAIQELEDNPSSEPKLFELFQQSARSLFEETKALALMTGKESEGITPQEIIQRVKSLIHWYFALRRAGNSLVKESIKNKTAETRIEEIEAKKTELNDSIHQLIHLFAFFADNLPETFINQEVGEIIDTATHVFHENETQIDEVTVVDLIMSLLKIYGRSTMRLYKEKIISEEIFIEQVEKILQFIGEYLIMNRSDPFSLQQIVDIGGRQMDNMAKTLYGENNDYLSKMHTRLLESKNASVTTSHVFVTLCNLNNDHLIAKEFSGV